ncbi:MAG: prenyltransferase/squalene oxidase repeat-containing protein, partial [bacterium]
MSSGTAYLEANQAPSGLWGEENQSPYRDATVVVEILSRLGGDSAVVAIGSNAVYGTRTSSVDYLARKIMVAAAVNDGYVSPTLLDSLAAMQSKHGGWGYRAGYASNVLETALAIRALKSSPDGCIVCLGAGVSFLLSSQNPDGGWSFFEGDSSSVFFTAHAILTLALLVDDYDVATQLQDGFDWMVTQTNPDGGFGNDGVSSPYVTGIAAAAMAEVDPMSAVITSARSYLESTQLPNGSWNDDAYSTALALYGLSHSLGLQGRSVALAPGLNLLGLPVEPIGPVVSGDILAGIPGCLEIIGWDGAGQDWLSGDFPIATQEGFFAKVTAETNMSLVGALPEDGQCTSLQAGLNAISIPNENSCYSAVDLVEDITDCQEVHKWDPSTQKWESIVRTYGDTLRGRDFAADPGDGYFVRVNSSSQWCTEACDTTTPPSDLLPDLVLWPDLILIQPNPAEVGAVVFIGAALYNAGTDTAFAPKLDFFFGDPDAGGDFFWTRDVPEDIPPGGYTGFYYGLNITFSDPLDVDIYVVVDYCNAIPELDETNNKAFQSLSVTSSAAQGSGFVVDEGREETRPNFSVTVMASIPRAGAHGVTGGLLT